MTLSPNLSEADLRPPKAGHQKEGILSDALFLVPVTGLDVLRALGLAALVRRRGRFAIGITDTKSSTPQKGCCFWCR